MMICKCSNKTKIFFLKEINPEDNRNSHSVTIKKDNKDRFNIDRIG